jgi:hypothetical protein
VVIESSISWPSSAIISPTSSGVKSLSSISGSSC